MSNTPYDIDNTDIAWCPGCGNFSILTILKQALMELEVAPSNLVVVSGIGQAAKAPHYFRTNMFNGLHGRALPVATAVKASNPGLTVIAESGDGDVYGEGGNHFMHAMRRNPDITNIVHDNMVYGLTKGQASPTSQPGFKTPVQVNGVFESPFNPIAAAIAVNASFVARAFAGHITETKDIIKKAITHKGYALVDIFQPCVTYNKTNTYQWFREHTYYLEDNYDPTDRAAAFKRSIETDKLPLGVFYVNRQKPVFEESITAYKEDKKPLYARNADRREGLAKLMDEMR